MIKELPHNNFNCVRPLFDKLSQHLPVLTVICTLLSILVTGQVFASSVNDYRWLNKYDTTHTIAQRTELPEGYVRTTVKAGSFSHWLRNLPLLEGRPKVLLYDGSPKFSQNVHHAVVDIDVGSKDLQQCADAAIRFRAEYLFAQSHYDTIHFNFTSGDMARWRDWINGLRPVVKGNKVTWRRTAKVDSSWASFRKYLDIVFTYAGSASLSREMKKIGDPLKMQIGDMFVQGGFPGHVVIVVDMAVDKSSGEKLFMLAQGFTPAQQTHLLINHLNNKLSPWYRIEIRSRLFTPQWIFDWSDLRRFR